MHTFSRRGLVRTLLLGASLMLTSPTLAQTVESRLMPNARQLILSGARSGEGYFGPNGQSLIFQSEREPGNPFFQMYLLDFQAGDIRRVSTGSGKTTCGWIHPNGQQVMYSSTHGDPQSAALQKAELDFRASGQQRRYSWDYDPQYEIYRAEADGSRPVNLTRTLGYDAEGAYSPDGKQIVFASNRQAYSAKLSPEDQKRLEIDPAYFMEIYTMDADGKNVRQLTRVKGYDGGPFFSADGQKITFRRFNEAGDKAEIWTMNRDGSDQRQITRLGVMSWAPFFHPSGDYLIFATNRHGFGNFELYLVDAAGQKEPVRVTYTEGFDGLPAFSPDGKQLAWTSGRTSDKASQLFLADWNDAEARRLLQLAPATDTHSADRLSTATTPVTGPQFVTTPGISADDLRRRVSYLASPELEGRLTGSPGEEKATTYAAEVFRHLGLEPAGDNGSYFQHFRFTAGVELGQANQLTMTQKGTKRALQLHGDWAPLVFSASERIAPSELVFGGYGLRVPANGNFGGYDSYVHLDVKDKWVVVLRYWPEDVAADVQQELKRHADLRYKATLARELGAKGLIVVNGPASPGTQKLIAFHSSSAPGTAPLPAISVSTPVVESWFQSVGQDLKTLQQRLDKGEAVAGFPLTGLTLAGQTDLLKLERTGRNVLARYSVPGATRSVAVGAHLDHLGKGHSEASLAGADAAEGIHFGADDNASGSAAVLEIAESVSRQRPADLKQNLLFALWSGEELGLLGSSHFVGTYSAERFPQQFSAYLNMDMVGRLDKALVLQGVGSSPVWNGLIEKHNFSVGLPLVLQQSAYLPTDATAFYIKGIPALSAFTGAHSDYHTPGDTADKLNYSGTEKVARLLEKITLDLARQPEAPAYSRQEPPKQEAGRGLRVYLGTIPDYASDVKGLRISGVSAGGPAEKAGLKAGDVIVALNGKTIENIYDYTYALDNLKVGVTAPITILRDGQRLEIQITPGSRN
ncbi:MAG: M28 family peptidase [Candidatus Sericytochromatia bacterium]